MNRPTRVTPMKTLTALALLCTATIALSAQQQQVGKPPQMPPRDPGQIAGPQTPTTGTASVKGQVTSVEGGRPLRRASVRLSATPAGVSRTTMTDNQGNYEFDNLPAGDYNVRANKPGYLEAIYGQKRPGSGRPGTPITIADAQHLEKVDFSIPRGGVITGVITDDMGEPVYGVPVRALRWASKNGERALVAAGANTTDDRGMYRIATLVPGDYVILATPVEDNGPMSDSDLRALKESIAAAPALAGTNVGFSTTRAVSGVAAMPIGNDPGYVPSSGYAPVFYPGTTVAVSAQSVALGPAEEKSAVDIQLQLVPLGTITGVVIGDLKVVQGTTIELTDTNTGLPGLSAKTTRPGADGKFSFTGVAPGSYTVTAKSGGATFVSIDNSGGQTRVMMTMTAVGGPGGPGGPGAPGASGPPPPPMWARAEVAVDGRQKSDVQLMLQPGMTVSGRIAFDGTGQAPTDFTGARVVLASSTQGSVLSGSAMGNVDADGKFRAPDVMPGRYKVQIIGLRGWRARSVDVAGQDALDTLLEVKAGEDVANVTATFTNKPSELAGTLQDSSGAPTSAYTIVLFAADQRFWTPQSRRILSTRPSTSGTYSFRDLPAGDYKLAAIEDAEPDSWFDPNILRQLAGASMSVSIVEGERKTQDIKIGKLAPESRH